MALSYKIDVPDELIQDIRLTIGDLPQFNRLIEGVESSDEKIRLAIQLFIHHFNNHPPITNVKYICDDFPNAQLLFDGVTINLLKQAGIIQTRNFLNFNDGGVSFSVNDKGSEYMQWIQSLMQTHAQNFIDTKVGINAEEGFNHINSPEDYAFIEDLS